jgi:chloride channel 7
MESLDYEAFDSAAPCSSDCGSGAAGWVMCFLIGGAMALAALVINLTVENLTGAKFLTASALLEGHGVASSFLFFAFVNVALAFSASAVTALYAPAAAGSGIGDVKAYLNGVDVPGMCLARTLAAKVAGSAGAVAGGLAVGKEGPFVHIGATLAVLLGQGGTSQRHLRWRWLASLRNDRARRDFVTIGASVGVTAAFRAPVGGLLFSLEELATHWRPQLTWRCFAANAVCVVTMRACMRWCAGSGEGGRCGAFDSTGALYLFDISPETGGQVRVMAMELLPMACLAVVGGLLGAAFNAASEILCTWRRDVLARRSPLAQVGEAVLLATITSAVCFFVPLAFACSPCPRHLGDCPRSAAHPTGNFVGFGCAAPGHYNDLATLLFNTPEGAIRNLFSSQTSGEFTPGSLVAFFSLFFTLSLLTYGTTIPSGLFVPSALCGATYGRLVGASLVARLGEASSEGIQEGTYALLGSAAFLAGATRMTVSLCVILLELTANLSLLPSMMAVLLIAKATGDLVNASAYDTHIALKRLPLLHASPERSQRRLTAAQLVAHQCGRPAAVGRHLRARDALALLSSCTHNGFPVLDSATGALQGLLLRRTLLALLRAQLAEASSLPAAAGGIDAASAFAASAAAAAANAASAGVDAVRWASGPGPAAELEELEAQLGDAQRDAVLDLGPWVNASPHSVLPDAPLRQVHALFREMGLRHLVVLRKPPGSGVMGIITRKDLLPHVIHARMHEAERHGVPLSAVVL